jgi:hypothetical protein
MIEPVRRTWGEKAALRPGGASEGSSRGTSHGQDSELNTRAFVGVEIEPLAAWLQEKKR